ncbi:MAG: DNA repair protein RecN [Clostridia bacterium]|nr:DNA repair protein RecN [Clostridia bacterium]
MLKSLKIKNVALIKEAEIEFDAGLNVLSGETGAGKSVVLDSLNFALGQKADKTMITYGQHDCAVTCVFDISNALRGLDVLDEIGVDYDDEIIVKRTLNIDGKSTIKLNGESVTATMLRKVTSHLVDIHGQSDHFLLLKESNQLAMLDNLSCKIDNIKEEISQKLALIRDIDSQLDTIGGDEGARERKLDYLRFSIDEINRVNLGKTEEEDLLNRKKMLLNAEKIIVHCSESVEALSGEEGVLDRIGDVSRRIGNISGCSVEYENILSRLEAVLEEVSDITAAINDSFDTDYDPAELDEIEARLAEIGNLKKKYGKTYDEIIGNLDRFQSEYNLLLASDELREKLLLSRGKELVSLDLIYNRLTAERKAVADNLCADLSNKLKELAMPGAEFLIDFTLDEGEVLSTKGRDNVTFMFTANKGEAVKPLSKVISGGELSRLMLAIKAVTGGNFGAETFIFDEIDAGISGEAAMVVAENFAKISLDKQIVAISHLPQIVSFADTGFLIKKTEIEERTVTNVHRLDSQGKVSEVVRLIGGKPNDIVAVTHAKQMINIGDQYKQCLHK